MDSVFRKRIKRQLYYGDVADLERPSLPLTEMTVEYFKDSVSQELGHIDLDIASDLVRKNRVSPCSVVMSMLYAKRLRQRNQPYLDSISSSDVFFISMMMASKYMYDEGVEEEVFNDEWAESFDQDVDDVNQMETDFLQAMDWSLFVRPEEFESILADIERRLALREGIRRGWFTYSEMAVLADWNLFTQLWNNVGLECTKLSVIMSASYVTSLISLLGTTAMAIQLSGPLSTAVVSSVSDHLVPAVTSGWQSLPHYLPQAMDYKFALSSQMNHPLKENQSYIRHATENYDHNPIKVNLPTEEDNVTTAILESQSEDVPTYGRSPSLLSILFLDSLLSQIWSTQSNNSKQKGQEKNMIRKEEHTFCHRRTSMKQKNNCQKNETSRSNIPLSCPPKNTFNNRIPKLSDMNPDDEFAPKYVDWPYENVEQLTQSTETSANKKGKQCCLLKLKSKEMHDDYSTSHKIKVDLPISLITRSRLLHLPLNLNAGFNDHAKIT